MKLNKDNKHALEIGDILDFGYNKEQYIITNVVLTNTQKRFITHHSKHTHKTDNIWRKIIKLLRCNHY